jgi:flagellar assembly protein FliH
MTMSSSREPVLRGAQATEVIAADFAVDLRTSTPPPSAGVLAAREAARATGYAEGWAQGQRAARVAAQAMADQAAANEQAAAQARAAGARRALAALAKAAADLDARRAPALAAVEDAILSAAVEVAEAIVGYEISRAEDRPVAAIRRGLAGVPEGGPVTVRVHPDDHRALVEAGGSAYEADGRAITVRPDAALAPGDAVAECGVVSVDATIATAVARVREVLGR